MPDDIEISGIPMSNGLIVYTDSNNSDTDGDSLTDGEEVGTLVRNPATTACTPEEAVVYKFCFNIKSDPTKEDSDNDGLLDIDDSEPLNVISIDDKFQKLGDALYSTKVYHIVQYIVIKTKSVWIAKPDDLNTRENIIKYFTDETNKDKFSDAILILDLTTEKEINYQIYNSYKYSDYNLLSYTLQLLIEYNQSFGEERSEWKRTLPGLYAEWIEHNLLYIIPNDEIKSSAQHADLDQYANGTIFGPDLLNYYEGEK